jgi:hypothetical protein
LLNSLGLFLDFSWVTGEAEVTELLSRIADNSPKTMFLTRAVASVIQVSF